MPSSQLKDSIAWGKLEKDELGNVRHWHPLLDHKVDVASCFVALAQCRNIKRALERAANRPLSEVDMQRLAVLAFLHDIGKANAGFQGKRWAADRKPSYWPLESGHSAEAMLAFSIPGLKLHDSLSMEQIASWGDVALDLLVASISHHGRPVGNNLAGDPRIWRPVCGPDGRECYSPAATLRLIGLAARKMYPLAYTESATELPKQAALSHLFAGLVQLADWLGSDQRFFPFSKPDEDRMVESTQRADKAVNAIHLNIDHLREQLIQAHPTFQDIFAVAEARPMQVATAELGLAQLVILESETGSGKTEAALWRFTQLLQAGEVDSLYFALPTRVAATQLYTRLQTFTQKLWPQNAPAVVRALPGYEAADGQSKECLPHFKVLWADHPNDREAHKRWVAESPKRFLAATLAVGTVDQALLGTLKVRHAHLRHALLSRSLLVVDEVHASDAYMGALLEELLAAHLRLGGHALLLSATLGSVARSRYQSLLRKPGSASAKTLGLAAACQIPYPALSDGLNIKAVAGSARQKTIHWQTLDAIASPERIVALALAAAKLGARVLIIRNTVPAAVSTLQTLEAQVIGSEWESCLFKVNGISTLHHSRFSRQDRPLIDQEVEAQIGKQRHDRCGRIVIGTQTLEQSLDLDADLLITDLCPMDVLLQRIGRLHRHERPASERPADYREAKVYVLTPERDDLTPLLQQARYGLGLMRLKNGERGGVYPDLRMLEATRRLVSEQSSRVIPADNRLLVEQATHPESLVLIEKELGEPWKQLGQEIEGGAGAKRSIAMLHAMPFEQPFDEELVFPEGESIATRLGAADRLVDFTEPMRGPFGQNVRQLALRHHQLPPGLSFEAMPSDIKIDEGTFEFSLGEARYRYHRFGLEKLKAESNPVQS